MSTLVIYDSTFGNTQHIAQIITEQLRASLPVQLLRASEATMSILQEASVLLVGCPTQWYQPTPTMQTFLECLPQGMLKGKMAAVFDTRYQTSCWSSGSAAWTLARALQRAGASLLVSPESFFVSNVGDTLLEGEREHALQWTETLLKKLEDVSVREQPIAPSLAPCANLHQKWLPDDYLSPFTEMPEPCQQHRQTLQAFSCLLTMVEALATIPTMGEATAPTEAKKRSLLLEVGIALAEITKHMLNCSYVGIFALDTPELRHHLLGISGLPAEQEACLRAATEQVPLSDYLSAPDLAQLEANHVVICDLSIQPFVTDRPTFGARYRLFAPIILHEQLIGLFTIAKTDERSPDVWSAYPQEEIALAKGIACLTAQVIERVRLLQQWSQAHANEQALQETTHRYDAFLALASHELRNPLTSITSNVQLALRRLLVLERQGEDVVSSREMLERIHQLLEYALQSSQSLNRMIGDFLDVARVQSKSFVIKTQLCDLGALVRQTVARVQALAGDRTFIVSLPPEQAVLVHADADRITQMITNYLSNALKYAPADRPISVRLTVEGSLARVAVQDEGPGIPLAEQVCLWQRFYRAPGVAIQQTQEQFGANLGVGLYLCREIVELHHGQVGVQSAPGQGSTFWFTLALAPASEKGALHHERRYP